MVVATRQNPRRAIDIKKRRSDRCTRSRPRSPERPQVANRHEREPFWNSGQADDVASEFLRRIQEGRVVSIHRDGPRASKAAGDLELPVIWQHLVLQTVDIGAPDRPEALF